MAPGSRGLKCATYGVAPSLCLRCSSRRSSWCSSWPARDKAPTDDKSEQLNDSAAAAQQRGTPGWTQHNIHTLHAGAGRSPVCRRTHAFLRRQHPLQRRHVGVLGLGPDGDRVAYYCGFKCTSSFPPSPCSEPVRREESEGVRPGQSQTMLPDHTPGAAHNARPHPAKQARSTAPHRASSAFSDSVRNVINVLKS